MPPSLLPSSSLMFFPMSYFFKIVFFLSNSALSFLTVGQLISKHFLSSNHDKLFACLLVSHCLQIDLQKKKGVKSTTFVENVWGRLSYMSYYGTTVFHQIQSDNGQSKCFRSSDIGWNDSISVLHPKMQIVLKANWGILFVGDSQYWMPSVLVTQLKVWKQKAFVSVNS